MCKIARYKLKHGPGNKAMRADFWKGLGRYKLAQKHRWKKLSENL